MSIASALPLLAAIACGLLIGIERGWTQRARADGTRVAGVRTFALIGTAGGLAAIVAQTVSPAAAVIIAAGLTLALVTAFLRAPADLQQRDATTMVSAIVALLLGLVAGGGQPALALACAAIVTLLLVTRQQSHRVVGSLTQEELHAFAYFAVISVAVLPFLPNRELGPYLAWNPFRLWLVVVLITGFSVLGYIANRLFGNRNGTVATALIGGAYSSTAVTAAFSDQLRAGNPGPLSTGITLASAVMYVRIEALTILLAPRAAVELAVVLGPATVTAWIAAAVLWRREKAQRGKGPDGPPGKPFRLLPAIGFAATVAGAALLVRWAQADYGEAGGALSLFIAGSLDVDSAIVALSTLPAGAIAPHLAALALGGTAAVNMAFKIAVLLANARWQAGKPAALALAASELVLLLTLAWEFAGHA